MSHPEMTGGHARCPFFSCKSTFSDLRFDVGWDLDHPGTVTRPGSMG
jgi:hypothetical protein